MLSLQAFSLFAPSQLIGFDHYREMADDPVFWTSLGNTLIFMASAPIGIVLALAISLIVESRHPRARHLPDDRLPLLSADDRGGRHHLALDVRRESRAVQFRPALSCTSSIRRCRSCNRSSYALPSVLLANVWQILGFYMIILLPGLQSIPQNLYEAASIDGASARRQFLRITLPLLRPSLFLAFVIGIITSFTELRPRVRHDAGRTEPPYRTAITYIYKVAFELSRFDYAAALTMVNFVLFWSRSPGLATGWRAGTPGR